MPGDPEEARQHALTIVRLAQTSAYHPQESSTPNSPTHG
jgi:hypothetical protein